MIPPPSIRADPWAELRRHTSARIALGRCGGSLPTAAVLAFAIDHAQARDAVHAPFDPELLTGALESHGVPLLHLASRAADRRSYLLRPDLGRRLDNDSAARCAQAAPVPAPDIAVVIGDGLSATAAHAQVPGLLEILLPLLRADGFHLAPLSLVRFARVAVADEVGALLGARLTILLVGERPGLGTPDSLGAYLTWGPRLGRPDSERNCVSNIRPAGLPWTDAAHTIAWLAREALRRGLTGTGLKDERQRLRAGESSHDPAGTARITPASPPS